MKSAHRHRRLVAAVGALQQWSLPWAFADGTLSPLEEIKFVAARVAEVATSQSPEAATEAGMQ